MTIGDMVFFNASELPDLVIKLDEAGKCKRTIVTTFTCARRADVLEHPSPSVLPPSNATLNCIPARSQAGKGPAN
jgi:hypothetical protein